MGAVLTPDVGSPILPTDPVVFDLTDSVETMTNILIAVRHDTGVIELAHDGTSFTSFYASGSSRTVITNGFHYSLVRAGGWADTKVVVSAFPFAGTGVGLINFSSDFGVLDDPPGEDVALSVTGATAGPFGNASHVATFTVDSKGRLTASGQTAIILTDNSSSPIAHVGSGGATATSAANIGDVNTAVAAEATARAAADTSEATARAAADTTLTTNLATETTARIAGDTTLTTNLNTEITNRIAGDTTLTTNLATETAARIAGDAAVTALIPGLSSATPAAVDAGAGAAGTGTSTSRNDHKHGVTVGSPVATGTANADGTGTALARADHVHQTSFAGVAAALAAATADVSVNAHKITGLASGGTTPTNAANIADITSARTTIEVDGIATGTVQLVSLALPAAGAVTAYVNTVKDFFYLDRTSTLTADGITVVTALGGTGRWIRLLTPNSYWAAQGTWYVDSVNGSDENEGDVAGVGNALQTRSEYARRTDGQQLTQNVTVNIVADLLATDTVLPWRPQTSVAASGASGFKIRYQGTKKALFTGTLTGVVSRNGATGTTTKLTCAGLPTSWTASSLVGKIVEGLNGSGALVRAVVIADLGAKQAWVSPPLNAGLNGEDTFANGTAITVYDGVNLSTGGSPTMQTIFYQYSEFDYCRATAWELTGAYINFTNCFGPVNAHGLIVNAFNCNMNISVQGGYGAVGGGYGQSGTTAGTVGATLHSPLPTTLNATSFPVFVGGTLIAKQDIEVNVGTAPVFRMGGNLCKLVCSGYVYGVIASGTQVVRFDTLVRDGLVHFTQIPAFGGASDVFFQETAATLSTATLASKELNDIFNNRVIGPAGPTLNDNRSQQIAHLGSGGSTPTNAANIADVQLVSPLAAMTRVPKAGEYWVYCIDQDGRTLTGNDATAAPGIAVAPSRVVTVTGSDHVVASTLTWTFANAAFTSNDVGGSFKLGGATNAGGWVIATVVNSTTVTTTIAKLGGGVPVDETFTGGATLTVTGGRGAAMAAALALAVTTPFKTYERAGQLLPREGNLASLMTLVRPRTGAVSYKDMDGTTDADWTKWITNIQGWDYVGHRPTADFSNSVFDKIQCGFRTAPGTNAAGYSIVPTRSVTVTGTDNVVASTKTWVFANAAFTVTDRHRDLVITGSASNNGTRRIQQVINSTTVITDGTPVNETFSGAVTLSVNSSQRSFGCQLVGGGAAAFPLEGTAVIEGLTANGISDITGRRIRFLPTCTTVALQNFCSGVYSNDATGITPMFQIAALATSGDVFVIEEHELVIGNMFVKVGQTGTIGMVLARTFQTGGPAISHRSIGGSQFAGIEAPNDPNLNVHVVFTSCGAGTTLLSHQYVDETITARNIGCAGRGRLEPFYMPGNLAVASWFGMETGQRDVVDINNFMYGPGCINNGGYKIIGGAVHAEHIANGRVGVDPLGDESALYSTVIGSDTLDGTSSVGAVGGFFGSLIYQRTRFTAAGGASNYPGAPGQGAIDISGGVNIRIRGVDISKSYPAILVRGFGARVFIDDVISRDGGNVTFLDLQNSWGALIVIGTQAVGAVVPNASLTDIIADGQMRLSLATLGITHILDSRGNLIIGTAGMF